MYITTYNQIIRHLRARTPLLNLVLACERICDIMLPTETGNRGLVELDDPMAAERGAPVVVLTHDCLKGLSVAPESGERLKAGSMDLISKFVTENANGNAIDLVASVKGPSRLTVLYRKLVESEKRPDMRVLFVVSDIPEISVPDRRALLCHAKEESTATVMLVSPEAYEDQLLRTYMPVLMAERPSREELEMLFLRAFTDLVKEGKTVLNIGDSNEPVNSLQAAQACAMCLSGLHIPTALQILMLHIESPACRGKVEDTTVFRIDPASLSNEKAEILNKAGYVSLVNQLVSSDEIGGLEELKTWLRKRRNGFLPEASRQKLRFPRGAMLVGPPGTAKSMCAKLVAHEFGMPLIRLDMGSLFNSRLGSSERNMRDALQLADASSPCVLLLDELDKGVGGKNLGESDGGTSSRLLGTLLQWMQDHTAPVFVIATANAIHGLPPEITRPGRFDAVWFVDLPDETERAAIWRIHLGKVDQLGRTEIAIDELVEGSDGFSGAEIEQAVYDAMYDNFVPGQRLELTSNQVLAALRKIVPLAKARERDLFALRSWAQANARHASKSQDKFHGEMFAKQSTPKLPM